MAQIIPFRAIRPTRDKVQLVASRSVDNYDKKHLNEKLGSNPFTFLHVINPDFGDKKYTKPGTRERLSKVKRKFLSFLENGIFTRDSKPCYYVYQQIKHGNTYTGIVACTSVDDYENGVIKVHEQTITDRELKLKSYLEVCDFNAEPVLFAYENDMVIDELLFQIEKTEPEYFFTTTDFVTHRVWAVTDKKTIDTIQKRFEGVNAVYIADGHHRSASSLLLAKDKRKQNPNDGKEAPYNYYMGVFFSENQLKIYDFNRLVSSLNGLSEDDFIEKLKINFEVQCLNDIQFKPAEYHEMSMYMNHKWYRLVAKKNIIRKEDPVGSLDAQILTDFILAPILNIHDLKTDKNIYFVSGVKGMEELKKQVDSGNYAVAFGLFPVTMEHLKWIADTENIMPPKSTYVEPKLRSGMLVYTLSES